MTLFEIRKTPARCFEKIRTARGEDSRMSTTVSLLQLGSIDRQDAVQVKKIRKRDREN